MRTCRELEGLTIYTDELSYSLGAIKDICFLAGGSCGGYVLDGKKKDCAFIPFSAGDKLTDKGLYVSCQKGIEIDTTAPSFFFFSKLKKKMIRTPDGETLGVLEDVYFCMNSGTIVAYELSDGFFTELSGIRKQLHAAGTLMDVQKEALVLNRT
ncbi:prc-barrel domain-containing protein [Bacillus altitudinis]|uniref:PRC-barrel domain-containing protein n=1 Tax=Bacillus altitudinis TaxID=293387 RepID=UPI000762FBA4|nr:PRC-barrel domain-containing protein [Bacillus altitudinis]AMB90531.1 prc-barrel domain-containing protein [Bacillus altitudinis]